MYSYTLSLNSVLDGRGWLMPHWPLHCLECLGMHSIGGRVGLRASLTHHWHSIPGLSSLHQVALPVPIATYTQDEHERCGKNWS
jgi:hypothetical protein